MKLLTNKKYKKLIKYFLYIKNKNMNLFKENIKLENMLIESHNLKDWLLTFSEELKLNFEYQLEKGNI